MITHLHFDHVGGLVKSSPSGDTEPVFCNANHYVQKDHWSWANEPSLRDRGSFLPPTFRPIEESGRLVFLEGDVQIMPGLGVMVSNGHTPSMQMPIFRGRFNGQSETIVFPSDLLPTSAHRGAAWGMAYDLFPLDVIREKQDLLERAALEGWILVFEHDPDKEAARVSKVHDRIVLTPCEVPDKI